MSDNTPRNNAQQSPSDHIYTTATPIRFAPRSNMADGNVVMLDPRSVQQWQLDAYAARLDDTASQMARYRGRVEELESLVEVSASKKSEGQKALRDELEMLRGELDKMVIAQQEKKEGGWFLWKSFLVGILIGLAFLWSTSEEESLF